MRVVRPHHTWNLSRGAGKPPITAHRSEKSSANHAIASGTAFASDIATEDLMHFRLLAAAGVASLLLFTPAAADASCCDQTKMAGHDMKGGCCDMPCCADKAVNAASEEIDILAMLPREKDLLPFPAPPARQEVLFAREHGEDVDFLGRGV